MRRLKRICLSDSDDDEVQTFRPQKKLEHKSKKQPKPEPKPIEARIPKPLCMSSISQWNFLVQISDPTLNPYAECVLRQDSESWENRMFKHSEQVPSAQLDWAQEDEDDPSEFLD